MAVAKAKSGKKRSISARKGVRTPVKAVKRAKSTVKSVRRAASQPRLTKPGKSAKTTAKTHAPINGSRGKAHSAPVAQTNGQAGKAAKLNKSELEHFRMLLLEKRRELLGDVGSMESEAFKHAGGNTSSPMHMADVGTDNFEQEFTLNLLESDRKLLREISEALARIDGGTYGICEGTGQSIAKARLEATPWTKYCIEYARMLEQGLLPRFSENEERSEESNDDDED